MQRTYISHIPRVIDQGRHNERMNWLLAANISEANHRRLFRSGYEEEQMLLMKRPLSTEKAYAFLGLLLGAIPPAVVFARLFGYGLSNGLLDMATANGLLLFLCVLMNVICCLTGYAMGSVIGRKALRLERSSWTRMLVMSIFHGSFWGAISGVAGGFFFFVIGGFFGAVVGIPVGLVGFVVFAVIHRMLEHGGMIEARHFLPLASGITAVIVAFIVGL